MLIIDGVNYQEWTPEGEHAEDELEQIVIEHAKDIFGESSIYIDRKLKLKALGGIGSIPDGYAIIFVSPPEWHIIETELSSHPLHEHIVSQISKFVAGIANPSTRNQIISAIYNEINSDDLLKIIAKKAIGSEETYKFLSELIAKPPTITIIIEKKTPELNDALNAINHPSKKVIEFKTFRRIGAEIIHAHLFNPIFEIIYPAASTPPKLYENSTLNYKELLEKISEEITQKRPYIKQRGKHNFRTIATKYSPIKYAYDIYKNNFRVLLCIPKNNYTEENKIYNKMQSSLTTIKSYFGEDLQLTLSGKKTPVYWLEHSKKIDSAFDSYQSLAVRTIKFIDKFNQILDEQFNTKTEENNE